MKIAKLFIVLFFFTFCKQPSFSQVEINANYVIIQDHLSGKILFEKNADGKIYPASMTKIMTALVTFDLLKKGETTLDELITCSSMSFGPSAVHAPKNVCMVRSASGVT